MPLCVCFIIRDNYIYRFFKTERIRFKAYFDVHHITLWVHIAPSTVQQIQTSEQIEAVATKMFSIIRNYLVEIH